ncbi:MAG: glycosyl transferase family 1, partial [Candidatus Lokiarchaeota archaeon]|nr:glycosyl transferase family 1 [Candidatus Lokiarchaeota archaeon]
TPFEMPELKLDHIYRLTDDVGILQHAKFIVPIRKHGYSTDNNARALIATILTQNLSPEDYNLINLVSKYLSFLLHAFNEKNRRFRNFMGYDRRWLDETGTDDCHGRAIWSLGITIGSSKIPQLADIALDTFNKAVSILPKLTSPRAWALGLVGIHAYLIRFSGDSNIRRIREELAYKLYNLYLENASDNWDWIEEIITYDNGKIPEALLMSGQWIQNNDMVDAGIKMLEWLIKIQTNKNNGFSPIGNKGWYHKDGEKAIFDQQPIEAQSICEACVEAYKVTQNKKWISEARKCSEWFLGNNDINISLYDYKTGGCYDGLGYNGININQGAESTLAWLLTLLNMHSLDNLLEIIE